MSDWYHDPESACPECGHGPRWHNDPTGCTRMNASWCQCTRVYAPTARCGSAEPHRAHYPGLRGPAFCVGNLNVIEEVTS